MFKQFVCEEVIIVKRFYCFITIVVLGCDEDLGMSFTY